MSTREKWLWIVAGIAIILYALFPVAWIVSLSLKSSSDISNGQFLPTAVSWENYSQILVGDAPATCSCRRCATRSASA